MKKMMFTLVAMMTIAISANAMNSRQAYAEARMTTDRMATMLGLTRHQYDRVYQINVSYFLKIDGRNDARDLEARNRQLERVLTPSQLHKLYGHRADRGHQPPTPRHAGYPSPHHNNKGWRR